MSEKKVVATVVIGAFSLCAILCFAVIYKSKAKAAAREKEIAVLASTLSTSIARADESVEQRRFEEATSSLEAIEPKITTIGDPKLKDEFRGAMIDIAEAERDYKKKLKQGYSVFEGQFISRSEKQRILADRKTEEDRRIAEERQRLTERQVEQRGQEELESARRASEDARPTAKGTARQEALAESIESPVTLKVEGGELRIRFQFSTLYIPGSPHETRLGYGGFFFVTYQASGDKVQKKPIEGYFRVNGNAEKLTVQSSNENILAGILVPTAMEIFEGKSPTEWPLSRDLEYTDDRGLSLTAVGPGVASITVTLAGQSVDIPMKVVQLPINGGGFRIAARASEAAHTKDQVIKILGLPDERAERYLSWPDRTYVDGIFYSASDPRYGMSIEHWKYNKYPGAVIAFKGSNVNDVRSVMRIEVP